MGSPDVTCMCQSRDGLSVESKVRAMSVGRHSNRSMRVLQRGSGGAGCMGGLSKRACWSHHARTGPRCQVACPWRSQVCKCLCRCMCIVVTAVFTGHLDTTTDGTCTWADNMLMPAGMTDSGRQMFAYTHSAGYTAAQAVFEEAQVTFMFQAILDRGGWPLTHGLAYSAHLVCHMLLRMARAKLGVGLLQASHDPNAIAELLHQTPYHTDALLAMSQLYRVGPVYAMCKLQVMCIFRCGFCCST